MRPARAKVLRVARILVVNVIVLAVLGGAAELFARVALPRLKPGFIPLEHTYPGQYSDRAFVTMAWPRQDPKLGWVCREMPNVQFGNPVYTNRAIAYGINPQGFRSPYDFAARDREAPRRRVALLGDSFMFGVYLDEDQTIAARLEELLGDTHRFYNLAMAGWGVDQMYLGLVEFQAAIRPDVTVLLYIDEDVERLYQAFRRREGMSKPSFAIRGDALVLRAKGDPVPWLERVFNHVVLLNPFHKAYARATSVAIAERIFADLGRRAGGPGQRAIVIRCPLLTQVAKRRLAPDYDFAATLARSGVAYVDLAEPMSALPPAERERLYLPSDMHLSPAGCRFVGDVIAELLATKAPSPVVGAP